MEFDRSEDKGEEHWLFLYFGGTWVDSRVYGEVTGKTGERWLDDGTLTKKFLLGKLKSCLRRVIIRLFNKIKGSLLI